MPTIKELVEDVHADPNAVSSANKGIEAIEAFVNDLKLKLDREAYDEARHAANGLSELISGLKHAIPAGVIPATAGPVGQSPHEQYLAQAATIVHESLEKMREVLGGVHKILEGVNDATQHVVQASAAIQSPDLKAKP
jgi:hypothetical protein